MRNIIVIYEHEPLTPRVFKIFNIEELRISGYIVEYRDISQLLYPGMKMPDEIEDKSLMKISNIQEFIKSFENDISDNTIYIVIIPVLWKNRKLFRILREKKRVVVRLDLYSTIIVRLSLLEKIQLHKGKLLKLSISKIEQFANKIYQLFFNFKPFDIEITTYSKFQSSIPVYAVNHPDYEFFCKYSDTEGVVATPYAVFLDEYFPYHPDFEYYSGIKTSKQTAVLYQQKMSKFFDYIEAKYKLKVVIAVHPKSSYENGIFGFRSLIKNRTCELVKNSEFVILHCSSSINYAVLYKKPLIITNVNDFSKYLDWKKRTEYLSLYFNCPLVNLDNEVYDIPDPDIDIVACNNYLYTYMTKKGHEKMTNSDIISNIFQKL